MKTLILAMWCYTFDLTWFRLTFPEVLDFAVKAGGITGALYLFYKKNLREKLYFKHREDILHDERMIIKIMITKPDIAVRLKKIAKATYTFQDKSESAKHYYEAIKNIKFNNVDLNIYFIGWILEPAKTLANMKGEDGYESILAVTMNYRQEFFETAKRISEITGHYVEAKKPIN